MNVKVTKYYEELNRSIVLAKFITKNKNIAETYKRIKDIFSEFQDTHPDTDDEFGDYIKDNYSEEFKVTNKKKNIVYHEICA